MGLRDELRRKAAEFKGGQALPANSGPPDGTVIYGEIALEPTPGNHAANGIANCVDPFVALWRYKTGADERRLYVGMNSQRFEMLAPDTNLLVVAPAQSIAGKTSSVVIPNVILWKGPVISTSTKADVLQQTALVRSAVGVCWHLTPDAEETAPGCQELRWSMVHAVQLAPAAQRWDLASDMSAMAISATGRNMAEQSDTARHFSAMASSLLAPLIYAAAIFGYDMRWVLDMVTLQVAKDMTLNDVEDLLAVDETHHSAARSLSRVLATPDRERGSVFTTCANALMAYERDSALATTDNPNFDMDAFVAGDPDVPNPRLALDPNLEQREPPPDRAVGRYDTVYITADRQELLSPIIVAFLTHARHCAAWAQRVRQWDALAINRPTLFCLDEMGTMAALPDLPEMLAKGGRGTVVLGVLQDMSQARQRWGQQGMGLATLFQNIAIFPGLRDRDTLELFSSLAGEFERQRTTRSVSSTKDRASFFGGSDGETTSYDYERFPRLPIDVVANGRTGNPYGILLFKHGSSRHTWVHASPFFRATPWPQLLIKSVAMAIERDYGTERIFYPLPMLVRDGYLQAFGDSYIKAYSLMLDLWPALQRQRRSERQTPGLNGGRS